MVKKNKINFIIAMGLKIEINDYIIISSERDKILIYIQGEKFQEYEYSFIEKTIKKYEVASSSHPTIMPSAFEASIF